MSDTGAVGEIRQFGTAGLDEPAAIATDLGRRYVVGTTRGSLPGHTNAGGRDGFVGRVEADPSVLAADTFTRTTTWSWGRAGVGGGWQVAPRSRFATSEGSARVSVVGGAAESAANLRSVDAGDASMTFTVELDAMPVGGSTYLHAVMMKDGVDEQRMRLRITPGGDVMMRAIRRSAGSWSPLGGNVMLPMAVEAGTPFRVRFDTVTVDGGVRMMGVAWPAGTARPDWQVDVVDATPRASGSGSVGLRFSSPSPSAGVVVAIDDLSVVDR